MAFPVFRAKDAAQIGMADERYAHQVEDLALVPLGRAPYVADLGTSGSSPGVSSRQRGIRTFSTSRCRCVMLER